MKRKSKFIIILTIIFLTTGCVKFNGNININKDKSLSLKFLYAIDNDYLTDDFILTDEQINNITNYGYTIEEYNNNNMQGYTITKDIKNIDSLSTENITEFTLTNLFDEDMENNYIFNIQKNFIKNTYSTNLKLSDFNDSDPYFNPEIIFELSIPYPALTNNATKTNDDNTKLTWNLTENTPISCSFELYNENNVYNGIGLAVFTFLAIISLGTMKRRPDKKNPKKNIYN